MENKNIDNEDCRLRELFSGFDPKLGSDLDFMTRLEQRLDSVEYIRCQTVSSQRRSRKALLAAVLTGFVCGILSSLAIPYFQGLFTALYSAFPNVNAESSALLTSWLAVGALTVLITLTVYDISLALQKPQDDK